MKYQRFGNMIAVRLEVGDDIGAKLTELAEKEKIGFASVSGIGATDDFTVGIFDMDKGTYDRVRFTGNHEITSLSGNLSRMNGEAYTHLHITCAGKNGAIVGGHLLGARISLTAEITVTEADGQIERRRDEALGINLLSI